MVGEQAAGSRGVGRPRDDARREHILAAALEVFARDGYRAATMKALATEAGLGSAAHLQHYYRHKDDLFAATLVRYLSLAELIHDDELDEPPRTFLPVYVARFFEQFADRRRLLAFKVFNENLERLLTMGLDLSAARLVEVQVELERYLQRQVDLGRIVGVGVPELRMVISGAISTMVQDRSNPLVPTAADEVLIAAVVRVVLDGVATDAPTDASGVDRAP